MMKAMKKLRLWSKKRKKGKKTDFHYSPSSYHYSLCTHCSCSCSCQHFHSYSPVQPSAPPLPPWIQTPPHPFDQLPFQEEDETALALKQAQPLVAKEETAVYQHPGALPADFSYQLYFGPPTSPPACAIPLARIPASRMLLPSSSSSSSSSKLFGCFGGFFRRLKGCFCSCFGIS